jgi:hypothetical protein
MPSINGGSQSEDYGPAPGSEDKCVHDGGTCGLGGFCAQCPQQQVTPIAEPAPTPLLKAITPDPEELAGFIKVAKEQGHDCEQRLDGSFANIYLNGAWLGWQQRAQYDNPALEVWYGPMPESNGKSNFTAILKRKDAKLWDEDVAITIDRGEYPERVRYEADRVRFLIGEIDKEPCILDYDPDVHSGYVKPPVPAAVKLDDAARAEFEHMVMSMEHRPYGWLGQEWLERGDDQYGYASEYVQGLWVMYQITIQTRAQLKSLWDDTGLRCLMRPDQVRRIAANLGEKIDYEG